MHEEEGGKNDLGSQCAVVGSPVDQGVSIRLDTDLGFSGASF